MKEPARVQQTLALKDNRLIAKAIVDSKGIYLPHKERCQEEQKVQLVETVIEKEVNVLKWWQKALMWAGAATVGIVFGRFTIGIFFRKSI